MTRRCGRWRPAALRLGLLLAATAVAWATHEAVTAPAAHAADRPDRTVVGATIDVLTGVLRPVLTVVTPPVPRPADDTAAATPPAAPDAGRPAPQAPATPGKPPAAQPAQPGEPTQPNQPGKPAPTVQPGPASFTARTGAATARHGAATHRPATDRAVPPSARPHRAPEHVVDRSPHHGAAGPALALLTPVTEALRPVTEPVSATVLAPLADLVGPVLQPLAPVLMPVGAALRPVLAPLAPVVEPLAPVTDLLIPPAEPQPAPPPAASPTDPVDPWVPEARPPSPGVTVPPPPPSAAADPAGRLGPVAGSGTTWVAHRAVAAATPSASAAARPHGADAHDPGRQHADHAPVAPAAGASGAGSPHGAGGGHTVDAEAARVCWTPPVPLSLTRTAAGGDAFCSRSPRPGTRPA
ncbi:hypothetical protein ACIBTV_29985 [Micromonospora sp. NPDC049366]|uniref:hypothetical protein n=1 Tax=Micromonospora sp. NPDC049366 TaxID=3364271 RepID=UPI00379F243A